jgi:uncharacterized protein (TIGR04551 family)
MNRFPKPRACSLSAGLYGARATLLCVCLGVLSVAGNAHADRGPTLLDEETGESSPVLAIDVAAPAQSTPSVASTAAIAASAVAAAPSTVRKYPHIELHGYFRFRPDLISNGHLGQAVESEKPQHPVLTTSSILPPLSKWPQNQANGDNPFGNKVGESRDEDSIAGANMRLRLAGTVHASENVRLRLTVDALDNYVLGSKPDFAGALKRPDVPLSAFAMTTQPGDLRVTEAYGEWKTLFGVLRMGRQSSHWGLGILANGGMGTTWDGSRPIDHYYGGGLLPAQGSGYDADFGNFSDRVAFVTKIPGLPFYTALFWDFVSSGSLAVDPLRVDGVPFDIEEGDDVTQLGIALFNKPLTPAEKTARRTLLIDDEGQSFDWGLYSVFRTQKFDINDTGAKPSDQTINDTGKLTLMPREAWAAIGDLWFRYENRLAFDQRLIIEAEWALITGKIEDASPIAAQGQAKPKEIMMHGGALKAAYQNEGLGVYLDLGYATGDDTRCFGVYGPGNCSLDTADGQPNEKITGFKFHKNYRVDTLMFRDVIGAVTNSFFVKPTVSINAHPFYALGDQLGVDLSVMHARSFLASGTPGNGSTLGTELAATAFVGQKGLFLASLTFAYLVPGDAFNVLGTNAGSDRWLGALNEKTVVAENSWRLLSRFVLMF